MSITYNIKIHNIEVIPQIEGKTDVVQKINWIYSGTTDDGRTVSLGNSLYMTFDPLADFVEYNSLTEDKVMSWIYGSINEDRTAAMNAVISSQLETVEKDLPWVLPVVTHEAPKTQTE